MAKNYTYPRVDLKTRALNHSVKKAEVLDTTVWFCPIKADRGPTGEITKLHSLDEFLETYGSLSYEKNGQTALMVYNWLSNGGTIYGYRLHDGSCSQATAFLPAEESKSNIESFTSEDAGSTDELEKIEEIKVKLNEPGISYVKLNDGGNSIELKAWSEPDEHGVYTATSNNQLTYSLKFKKGPIVIEKAAKYVGDYYNDLSVEFSRATSKSYNISVFLKTTGGRQVIVEQYFKRSLDKISSTFNESDYISSNFISDELKERLFYLSDSETNVLPAYSKGDVTIAEGESKTFVLKFYGGQYTSSTQDELVKAFFTGYKDPSDSTKMITPCDVLLNDLESPIDVMLDAGYSVDTKSAMIGFISNNESVVASRRDIVGIFDAWVLKGYLKAPDPVEDITDLGVGATATNIAIYDQYFTINDAAFTDQNIYVTPTYFLSKLLPYNDLQYGIQFPTAGLRRGVLSDAIAINENPNPEKKESLFKSRINYVEKSSREYAFMCQRTHDGSTEDSYTALSFLNNERVLEKMKKELKRLGREYLFEFNDSVTLSNMASVLNKYVTNWISNRTLSKGLVEVAQNPYNEEAVDIFLTVRFTGTIEVITVDITIE